MSYSTVDVTGSVSSTQSTPITISSNRQLHSTTSNNNNATPNSSIATTHSTDSTAPSVLHRLTPHGTSTEPHSYSHTNDDHIQHRSEHSDDILHSLTMLKSSNNTNTPLLKQRNTLQLSEPSLTQLPVHNDRLDVNVTNTYISASSSIISDNDSELPGSESMNSDVDTHTPTSSALINTHTDSDLSILHSPLQPSVNANKPHTIPQRSNTTTQQQADGVFTDSEIDDSSVHSASRSVVLQEAQDSTTSYPAFDVTHNNDYSVLSNSTDNTSHTSNTNNLQAPITSAPLTYPSSYLSSLDPSSDYPFKTPDGHVLMYCIGKVNLQLKDQNCRRGGAKAATLRFDLHNVGVDTDSTHNNNNSIKSESMKSQQLSPVDHDEHKQLSAPLPLVTPPSSPSASHHTNTLLYQHHHDLNSQHNQTVRALLESKLYSKKGFFNKYAKYVRSKYGVTLINPDCAYFAVEENRVKDLVMMSTAKTTDARNPRHALQVDTPYSIYFFATNKNAWVEHTNTEKHADVEVVVTGSSGNVILKYPSSHSNATMQYQQHRLTSHGYNQHPPQQHTLQYNHSMPYNTAPQPPIPHDMHYQHSFNNYPPPPSSHYNNQSPDNPYYRHSYPPQYNSMPPHQWQSQSNYMPQSHQPYLPPYHTQQPLQYPTANSNLPSTGSANASPTAYYTNIPPPNVDSLPHNAFEVTTSAAISTQQPSSTQSTVGNNFANVLLAAASSQSGNTTDIVREHSTSPGQLSSNTSLNLTYPVQSRNDISSSSHSPDHPHQSTVIDDSLLRDLHGLDTAQHTGGAEYFNSLPHRFTSTSSNGSIKRKLMSSGSSGFNSPPHVSNTPSTGSVDSQGQSTLPNNTATWTPQSSTVLLDWNTSKRRSSVSQPSNNNTYDNSHAHNTAGQQVKRSLAYNIPPPNAQQQYMYHTPPPPHHHQLHNLYKQEQMPSNEQHPYYHNA